MISSIVDFALEGARLNALLVAVIEHRLAEHLSRGPATAEELAERAGVSARGCRAVADGMVALRLWKVERGIYRNSKLADRCLLPDGPDFVGSEHPALFRHWLPMLARVDELVRDGVPAHALDSPETLDFWTKLTPLLARQGEAVAQLVVDLLGLERGSPHLLDVGGGSRALYSRALLARNPSATATQLDWPHINEEAHRAIEEAGFADRFERLNGDFHALEMGEARYDVAVLSHVIHQESPASNRRIFGRVARALRPGGALAISDFVVADGRDGPPFSLLFNMTMLFLSEAGKTYERAEIREMLVDCGFDEPTFTESGGSATLVTAVKP